MRKWFIEFLNRHGLFTFKQHAEVLDERAAITEYAHYLERALNGMPDLAKPIVVIGDYTRVHDVCLRHGQQVIVSPFAKFTDVRGVMTVPANWGSTQEANQGELFHGTTQEKQG